MNAEGEALRPLYGITREAAYYHGKILSGRFYLGNEFKHLYGYLDYITSGENAVEEAFEDDFTGALAQ